MRSRRLIIVLLLALASGLAAGWLALNYLRQPNSPISTSTQSSVEVVVASRDLPVGHILDVADIKVAQWPGDVIPEGYSSSVDEVLGRGLIQNVAMNEPLMPAKIAVKEAGGGLPIVIPEGMRAVSIRVDEVIQVAGFVGPGTRVDVMVTLEGENQPDPVTKIVLQNMLVLTSGQVVQRSPDGEPILASVVTFLATPEEAEKLVLSATKGRIQLALRNTLDLDSLTTEGARLRALIPVPQSATPRRPVARTQSQPAASRARTIEVFRGQTREEENIEGGGS